MTLTSEHLIVLVQHGVQHVQHEDYDWDDFVILILTAYM